MLMEHVIVLMAGWGTTVHNLAGYNLSFTNCEYIYIYVFVSIDVIYLIVV